VCLVWIKKDPLEDVSDDDKNVINEAIERWLLGSHSVSIWMINPNENDKIGINTNVPVCDITIIFENYGYDIKLFNNIEFLYLKIDIAKIMIPLYILDKGLNNMEFCYCIASDLDVGTLDPLDPDPETEIPIVPEYNTFDLKYLYDKDTIEKLNKMGVVFAKGPGELTKYENSFAIFKKDMYVINSLKVFVDVLMNLDKHAIKPGEQVVWNWIPSFFNHLKCKKYGGVIYDNMNPDKEIHGDLKTLLFRGPYIRHYCDTRETILLKDFLKYVPVPRSKFAGGSKLRYRSLLTFGLAMLTIVAGFVPYRS
jgi:hypothetical protein